MTMSTSELPWSWEQCAKGWEADPAGGEHAYWLNESEIEGELPPDLIGTLLRNGPGSIDVHGNRLNHPIDGDGLVCGLTFTGDGRVHFRSRFVNSKHRQAETQAQKMLYRGQMGSLPPHFSYLNASINTAGMLLFGRKKNPYPFRNPSNTNVVYWAGKLLTAYETHMPHRLNPNTFETEGIEKFDGSLSRVKTFAAHFREDPQSGNLIILSSRPAIGKRRAIIQFTEFDPEWKVVRQQIHHIDGLNYVHDFAMTPNYLIVQMTPFVHIDAMAGLKILSGTTSPGEMMRYYEHLPSKLVLIPRYKGAGISEDSEDLLPIQVDDISPVHIFHFGTAFENNESVELTAVCLSPPFQMHWDRRVWLSNTSEAPGLLYRYRISLPKDESPRLDRKQIDDSSCEFPIVDTRFHGEQQRFVYLMANARKNERLPYRDIVKCDVLNDENARDVWYSDGLIGEPTFAPRNATSTDGDDGWIIAQYHQPSDHKTQFVILDAKKISEGPICRLMIRHHVPFSFHTTFCKDLIGLNQKDSVD